MVTSTYKWNILEWSEKNPCEQNKSRHPANEPCIEPSSKYLTRVWKQLWKVGHCHIKQYSHGVFALVDSERQWFYGQQPPPPLFEIVMIKNEFRELLARPSSKNITEIVFLKKLPGAHHPLGLHHDVALVLLVTSWQPSHPLNFNCTLVY